MVGLWNFGLVESLSVKSSVACSLGAWKVRMLRADEGLECEDSEGSLKSLSGSFVILN